MSKRIGLVHICENNTAIYEALLLEDIEVVFHSMPIFAWDEYAHTNAKHYKSNIHFFEVVNYF